MKRSLLPLALFGALTLAACDDDDASGSAADAGADVGADATADAGANVGTDATADADVFAACDGARLALDQCYRGAAFAECGGTGEPTVFCDMADPWVYGGRCLWFTGGCPALGFDHPKTSCETYPCGNYADYQTPQERATDQRLPVQVGPPATTAIACEVEGSDWSVCDDFPSRSVSLSTEPGWGWPGNLAWVFWLDNSAVEETERDPAPSVLIEVDPVSTPVTARVCRLSTSDEPPAYASPPICDGAAGTVTLSHVPTTAAERDAVSMSFDLTFTLNDGGTLHWVGAYAPGDQDARP